MAKKTAKKTVSKAAAKKTMKKTAKKTAGRAVFSKASAESSLGRSLSRLLGKGATQSFVTIERAESSCGPGESSGRFILEGSFAPPAKKTART